VAALTACGEEPRRVRRREYGPLVRDPANVVDLPRGFRYRVLSDPETRLTSGAAIPGRPDGMAAFPGRGGTTVLIRNHELGGGAGTGEETPLEGRRPYERGAPGRTTAVIVDSSRRSVDQHVSSSGTLANCAGGRTPWGTWLTCEETDDEGHGYVFEVIPGEPEHPLARTPIRGMGVFSHEAVGLDQRTGIVYMTEDDYGGEVPSDAGEESDDDGAFLYRYVPHDRRGRPGALQRGGRLEVLAVEEGIRELNADRYRPRQRFGVVWKPVGAEDPRDDAEETVGAVRFNRLEGAFFAGGALWFDDTLGGEERLGQIFRYLPGPNRLELFFEGTDVNRMENPDNLVVTPWGDLWFAENEQNEEGEPEDRIMGVNPEGAVYPLRATGSRSSRDRPSPRTVGRSS
jgi:secreted PhoX family phosphatase